MILHWAIYGQHKEGHAILAQSGIGKVADNLARFTDRPGDPPAGAHWTSATSGFVFEDYFILLRTVPDNSGRPGMVQSFAIFIPVKSLDDVQSLTALLALLPNEVIAIPSEVKPLELSKEDNFPRMIGTSGLSFILERLAASKAAFPLVWGISADHIPTIDTIWGRIPGTLREKLAFAFQFEPGNKIPVQPQIVATLPSLISRWPTQQLISQAEPSDDSSRDIVGRFLDVGAQESYRHLVSDFGLDLTSFQNMSHLARFSAIVSKGPNLGFDDLVRAVRILSAFGVASTETRHKKRMLLFENLEKLIPRASSDDILKLRNLPETSLPEFIPLAQKALKQWISQNSITNIASAIPILEAALDDLKGWWSKPFVNWLDTIAAQPSLENARTVAACIPSSYLARYLGDHLPRTTKWEQVLIEIAPDCAGHENFVALAENQQWLRLHASILADREDRHQSLTKHAKMANEANDGYEIFLQKWKYSDFLVVADSTNASHAIRFLATRLPDYIDCVKTPVFNALTNGALFWNDVLSSEELDPSIANLAVAFINRSRNLEIADRLLFLAPMHIFLLKDWRVILDSLGGKAKETLSRYVTDSVAMSLVSRKSISEYNPIIFEALIDKALFFQRLDKAPIHNLGAILADAFEQLEFLTDEEFSERLIVLFTRTTDSRITHEDAEGISKLFLGRKLPKSADVIFDTAEKYFRNDVKPIAMTIADDYQTTRKSPPATQENSGKLIPVLIATALPLERDAVVSHLGNWRYDSKNKFDAGVWPKDDPHFEISVIITGQGNLPTQRLVAEISKRIKPEFAFFLGVSGALKDGFFVGDVAYSTKVYSIEGGKEDSEGVKSRPELELVDENLVQLTHRVAGAFKRESGTESLEGFNVKDAVIASGGKVLASKSKKAANFQHARTHYNDSSIIELEGYGFMVAARTNKIKFAMVIRGVSDGCEGKDPGKDEHDQPMAAQNAARFLFTLLKQCPTLLSNKKQKRFFGAIVESVTGFLKG